MRSGVRESVIVTQTLQFLKSRQKTFAWKEHGGPYSTAGLPDIIACVDGRFVGLEVKTPVGKLTALQRATLERIRAAGGVAEKVASLEEAQTIINGVEEGAEE
jgi:hypothetical protein